MKKYRSLFLIVCLLIVSSLHAQTEKYGVGTNDCFKGPLGLQTYSIRHLFKPDLNVGMKQTKDWGFKYIEITTSVRKALPPDKLLALLDKYGLKGVIAHWGYGEWEKDPDAIAKYAKSLQLEYAGTASVPSKGKGSIYKKKGITEEECDKIIEVFNKAGDACARQGLRFVYHNHGNEFTPWKDGTLYDKIIQNTNPERVFFEMDILWTILPGEDPVRLFNKYPNRFVSCHLKDYKDNVHTLAVGTGKIDFVRILKAAQKTAIKYYFLEDESKNPEEQIPQSLKYLENIRW